MPGRGESGNAPDTFNFNRDDFREIAESIDRTYFALVKKLKSGATLNNNDIQNIAYILKKVSDNNLFVPNYNLFVKWANYLKHPGLFAHRSDINFQEIPETNEKKLAKLLVIGYMFGLEKKH